MLKGTKRKTQRKDQRAKITLLLCCILYFVHFLLKHYCSSAIKPRKTLCTVCLEVEICTIIHQNQNHAFHYQIVWEMKREEKETVKHTMPDFQRQHNQVVNISKTGLDEVTTMCDNVDFLLLLLKVHFTARRKCQSHHTVILQKHLHVRAFHFLLVLFKFELFLNWQPHKANQSGFFFVEVLSCWMFPSIKSYSEGWHSHIAPAGTWKLNLLSLPTEGFF